MTNSFELIPTQAENALSNSLLSIENFEHYMKVAEYISRSELVPRSMRGKPADILVAMEFGVSVGLSPMQALQDIAVINGKPSMYGDGLLALVQSHPSYEWCEEKLEKNEKGEVIGATCTIKRAHHEPHVKHFSVAEAKQAKLWGKAGPWSEYPNRMLQMRARGFAIRDRFADALRGLRSAEEVMDTPAEKIVGNVTKDITDKIKTVEAKKTDVTVMVSTLQLQEVHNLLEKKQFNDERKAKVLEHYKITDFSKLTFDQATTLINYLQNVKEEEKKDA